MFCPYTASCQAQADCNPAQAMNYSEALGNDNLGGKTLFVLSERLHVLFHGSPTKLCLLKKMNAYLEKKHLVTPVSTMFTLQCGAKHFLRNTNNILPKSLIKMVKIIVISHIFILSTP